MGSTIFHELDPGLNKKEKLSVSMDVSAPSSGCRGKVI